MAVCYLEICGSVLSGNATSPNLINMLECTSLIWLTVMG